MLLGDESSGSQKRVIAVVRKYPNYIFHLLALARIRYNSNYAEKYEASVSPDDLARLKGLESALSIGMRSGGELTFVIGFPIYFGLESRDELEEFFSLINIGIETDDFNAFFQEYKGQIERLSLWIELKRSDMSGLKAYKDDIDLLAKIIMRNYDHYETEIWGGQKGKITPVAAGIDARFENLDIISKWEKLTGIRFKLDCFNAVLCTAMKNGPDANSVGYDCVVFYYDRPLDELIQLISHEIGTHLLFDDYRFLSSQGKFETEILYSAYENLARYYNSLILEDKNLMYDISAFHDMYFNDVYASILGEKPEIQVRDLITIAANRFKNNYL